MKKTEYVTLLNDVRTLLITVQLQLSLYESCRQVYLEYSYLNVTFWTIMGEKKIS